MSKNNWPEKENEIEIFFRAERLPDAVYSRTYRKGDCLRIQLGIRDMHDAWSSGKFRKEP